MTRKLILIVVLFSGFFTVKSQSEYPLSKERIIQLYDSLYTTSEIQGGIIWNGHIKKCDPGELSDDIYQKAQNRINFFRLVNGLSEVRNSRELNTDAQSASLLIKANNELTHYPKKSMKCYSESASNGCLKSCLGISNWVSFPKTSFVTGFIWDYGESNYFVGHRKWLLFSKLVEFGYGATNTSEAILTADGIDFNLKCSKEFVAYPWEGYVPVNLIFPKWSFSIPKDNTVDFSQAKIKMTDSNGKAIEIKIYEEYKNYLDPTIVWQAKGLFSSQEITYGQNSLESRGFLNKKIMVEISDVIVNGEKKNFKYFVEPIKI
ncbi:MAG: hypothetical protein OEY34_02625 [Cyclobacteriaceae bacterium]|nr:hypothetical protein [Cyclobacteriaceae bacterium]